MLLTTTIIVFSSVYYVSRIEKKPRFSLFYRIVSMRLCRTQHYYIFYFLLNFSVVIFLIHPNTDHESRNCMKKREIKYETAQKNICWTIRMS